MNSLMLTTGAVDDQPMDGNMSFSYRVDPFLKLREVLVSNPALLVVIERFCANSAFKALLNKKYFTFWLEQQNLLKSSNLLNKPEQVSYDLKDNTLEPLRLGRNLEVFKGPAKN
ncbi:unnamed protein product [Leptidea sinapis]|uniref:Uncharacterized protein n=1 Tax=Leptidea sinapis TaxID=189913 RepID=A0A5E4QKU8_9NEOP|nr:unnamed protein product [Leptidea sinapis]